MSKKSTSSPIVPIALLISALLAVVVAYSVLSPPNQETEIVSAPEPVAEFTPSEVVEETPSPTTPIPTPSASATPPATTLAPATPLPATPAPTASPEPSPEPTTATVVEPLETAVSKAPEETPTPQPEVFVVEGVVRNYEGRPAPNSQLFVVVKTEGKPVDLIARAFEDSSNHSIITADEEGRYDAKLPLEQEYIIGALVDGEPKSTMQIIASDSEGSTEKADFYLPEPYLIRGVVRDEFGNEIPDVPIRVTSQAKTLRRGAAPLREASLVTDIDGTYRFSIIDPAEVILTVDGENLMPPYLYDGKEITVRPVDFAGLRTLRLDLEVINSADFGGQVVMQVSGDEEPVALSGVSLRLVEERNPRSDAEPRVFEASTDEFGQFSFERLPPVAYSLTVKHPDYVTIRRERLNLNEIDELEIAMNPLARVSGTLTFQEPALVDMEVTVALYDRYNQRSHSVLLNQGEKSADWFLDKVDQGVYWVVAKGSQGSQRYYGERIVVVPADGEPDPLELKLRPVLEIRGRLVGKQFESAPGVIVINAGPTREPFQNEPSFAVPDGARIFPNVSLSNTGTFTVENVLSGESYKITTSRRDTKELLGSAIATAGDGGTVLVPTDGVGTVAGRIAARDGSACRGQKITLITGLGTSLESGSVKQEWTYETDFDGTYLFRDVPAGQARLILSGEQETKRLISVQKNQITRIELECKIFVDVDFHITGDLNPPLRSGEQFIIVAKPGYLVETNFRELAYGKLGTRLEPGRYLLTRSDTMESREFEVIPRLDGIIEIEF